MTDAMTFESQLQESHAISEPCWAALRNGNTEEFARLRERSVDDIQPILRLGGSRLVTA